MAEAESLGPLPLEDQRVVTLTILGELNTAWKRVTENLQGLVIADVWVTTYSGERLGWVKLGYRTSGTYRTVVWQPGHAGPKISILECPVSVRVAMVRWAAVLIEKVIQASRDTTAGVQEAASTLNQQIDLAFSTTRAGDNANQPEAGRPDQQARPPLPYTLDQHPHEPLQQPERSPGSRDWH